MSQDCKVALVPFAFYDSTAATLRALSRAAIAGALDGGKLSAKERAALLDSHRLLQL